MLTVAVVAAALAPFGRPLPAAEWTAVMVFGTLAVLALRGGYRGRLNVQVLEDLGRVAAAVGLTVMAAISVSTLLTGDGAVAAETAAFGGYLFGSLAVGRLAVDTALRRVLRSGVVGKPTLILGAGKVGNLTAKRLLAQPEMGFAPVGFLDDDPLEMHDEDVVLPVLGGPPDLDRVIADFEVEHLIVGFSMASHQLMLSLVRRCWELGVSVSLVPRLFEVEGARASVDRLGGLPLVSLAAPEYRGLRIKFKYGLDRVVAALALVALSPLFILVTAAIRITMGAPVLYGQHRMGRDGQHFVMWKFRTMTGSPQEQGEADEGWAEAASGSRPTASMPRASSLPDDRRTPLGRLLRKASLDELPQLWNVLRGEMSMIGPRPERVHYVERFEDAIYRYGDRHRVKSGITGWAQVNGLRGETSLADRVEWDNYYIENWSLRLDFRIGLRTLTCVARDALSQVSGQAARRRRRS